MKKILSALLIALLVLGTISISDFSTGQNRVYAATGASAFIDLHASHWGYSYVDFAAINGIITGYATPDGRFVFKSENPVSKEEALAMIYRALGASGKLLSIEDFSSDYQAALDEGEISSWARKFVAYGLKYNIVTLEELESFNAESGAGLSASREQTAVWTAKALGGKLMQTNTLLYGDLDQISTASLPYVDLLFRLNIMKGDNQGRFMPNASIKRVEFAAVTNRIFTAAVVKN